MVAHLLRRIALVAIVAGQGSAMPGMRVGVELLPAITVAAERVQRYVTTAPRWGHAIDRATTITRNAAARGHIV